MLGARAAVIQGRRERDVEAEAVIGGQAHWNYKGRAEASQRAAGLGSSAAATPIQPLELVPPWFLQHASDETSAAFRVRDRGCAQRAQSGPPARSPHPPFGDLKLKRAKKRAELIFPGGFE